MNEPTIKLEYLGGLKCQLTHCQSGTQLITDAPKDNNGDGNSFSPTDAMTGSLAACYMTIMGISARNHGINIDGTTVDIKKIMFSDPRRVGHIKIRMQMPNIDYSKKQKDILTAAANACPVSRSLHPELIIDFQISW